MDQNEHPAASRRGFLRSGAMAALAGAVAAPVAMAAVQNDPTFFWIEEHRRIWPILQEMNGDEPTFEATDDREIDIHERLCTTPPKSLPGVIALAEYLRDYILYRENEFDPACAASWQTGVNTIAQALRALAGLPAEEEA